ncbi:hypothetical protein D3C72_1755610 [compost metagenome]
MAVVQEQDHEQFPCLPAQTVLQVATDGRWVVADRFTLLQFSGQVAVGQLQPGGQCAAASRPQARQFRQVAGGAVQQHPQWAVGKQQVARGLYGVPAANAGTQEQGQQFGVGQ